MRIQDKLSQNSNYKTLKRKLEMTESNYFFANLPYFEKLSSNSKFYWKSQINIF